MKIIQKHQTKEFKNSDVCTAIEYPLGDSNINIAVIKLSGRYPATGYAVNEECKEIGFVMEGSGIVCVEGEIVKLETGDSVLIEPHEKFYWDGTMTILMPCTPAWTPQQYKVVG